MFDGEEYIPRNREKARQAKYGESWCDYCDRATVEDTGKCKVCGRRHDRSKLRFSTRRSNNLI